MKEHFADMKLHGLSSSNRFLPYRPRKARRISQAELADAVEVTRQTIISLENGRYNASLLLAHKIAQYFGLTIEDVFLFEEDPPC